LGLRAGNRAQIRQRVAWTPEEDAVLREHGEEQTQLIPKILARKGYYRTPEQVRKRMEVLGLRKPQPRSTSLCLSCARAIPQLCGWIRSGDRSTIADYRGSQY